MTLTTRLAVLALASTAAATGLAAAPADANPPINSVKQHVSVRTFTDAGQRRDDAFYAQWARDRKPFPSLNIHGQENTANHTNVTADSPVPGLGWSGSHGYCVTQTYGVSAMDPATANGSYRTTVVVKRHGKVVVRHATSGSYRTATSPVGEAPAAPTTDHLKVRLPHFTFRRTDHVTWTYVGSLSGQIKKYTLDATIAPLSCKKK